jgi:DNA invertase Pin-like site-specific DNA recombinase
MKHGYARVSTTGQILEAQIEKIKESCCISINQEKVSGARADRKELIKLIKKVR